MCWPKKIAHLVGSSIDTGPCIENEELMGLSISIHDCLEEFLILFTPFSIYPDHGLTAACHRRLALWVDPRQHLQHKSTTQNQRRRSITGGDWIGAADSRGSFLLRGRPPLSSVLHLVCWQVPLTLTGRCHKDRSGRLPSLSSSFH